MLVETVTSARRMRDISGPETKIDEQSAQLKPMAMHKNGRNGPT
ncbi:hypothetical protein ACK83U_20280 (plasmid) [Rhizobium sp. WW22]